MEKKKSYVKADVSYYEVDDYFYDLKKQRIIHSTSKDVSHSCRSSYKMTRATFLEACIFECLKHSDFVNKNDINLDLLAKYNKMEILLQTKDNSIDLKIYIGNDGILRVINNNDWKANKVLKIKNNEFIYIDYDFNEGSIVFHYLNK